MTTRELGLAHLGVHDFAVRHRRSVVTLGLALLGFFVGESFGQQLDVNCSRPRPLQVSLGARPRRGAP